jgi:hypothetical protein
VTRTMWSSRGSGPAIEPASRRHGRAAGGVLVAVALVVGGCEGAPGAPGGAPEPVDFRLEEVLRLGVLEGAEEEMFGGVSAATAGSDGSLFVLDRQVPVVRRFGPEGTFQGNVGREGEGPGEYRNPMGLQPLPDGGIALWDPGNARLSFFEADGTFREGFRVPSTLTTGRALATDTLGRFYVRTMDIPEGWRPSGPSDSPPLAWIRVSPSGEVVDTIPIPPEEPDRRFYIVQTPDGTLRPFDTRTVRGLGPGGEVLRARNDRYVILRGGPDGPDTLVTRDHDPVPLEGDERARWEAFQAYLEGRDTAGGTYAPLPRVKPALQDLFTDRGGRIWVRPHVEARRIELSTPPEERDPGAAPPLDFREMPVFHLFAHDGTFLGTLELPRKAVVLDASGDDLLLLERGELDEPYVVRYRLVGG